MTNSAFNGKEKIKVVAFDLDGTLTQHRSPLEEDNRALLAQLSKKYKLLMVGAGTCRRIFGQMGNFPIDIIGNYGLQYAEYDKSISDIVLKEETVLPCDVESVLQRADVFRKETGYIEYSGKPVEFHPSGSVTFPFLGTAAQIGDKLAFDPTREKRRALYPRFCELFPEFTVFVGGSSSYDMVPAPNDKAHALDVYCRRVGLRHENVLYVGDDYEPGGNDYAVFVSDFPFVCTDDYKKTKDILSFLNE